MNDLQQVSVSAADMKEYAMKNDIPLETSENDARPLTPRQIAELNAKSIRATSPQLPVAEQPAGQAVLQDDEQYRANLNGLIGRLQTVSGMYGLVPVDEAIECIKALDAELEEDRELFETTNRNMLALGEKVKELQAALAAAHSPVAQTSGETSPLRATLYAIANTLDDGELRQAAREAYDASQPSNAVQDVHPDDVAVDTFAAAMKGKLALAREKGRGGWEQCDPTDLSRMLREHVEKGDPRDVANFCMFLWCLGQPISAAPAASNAVPIYQHQVGDRLFHDVTKERYENIGELTRRIVYAAPAAIDVRDADDAPYPFLPPGFQIERIGNSYVTRHPATASESQPYPTRQAATACAWADYALQLDRALQSPPQTGKEVES